MIFGKHINRYYWRFLPLLLVGLFALIVVDYLQLEIPELYQMVINGINTGVVSVDGAAQTFDLAFHVESTKRCAHDLEGLTNAFRNLRTGCHGCPKTAFHIGRNLTFQLPGQSRQHFLNNPL